MPGKLLAILILMGGCCLTIKEEHLGNNLYLSEYDNVDRRILYSEGSCTGSGTEIVPMTVMEYAFNSEWIIAKSGNMQTNSNTQYWIIKNNYDFEPSAEVIKSNTLGPLDLESFTWELMRKDIQLTLAKVE